MLNAIFFYRISRWCCLHHIPLVPELLTLLIFLVNSKALYQVGIGKSTKLGYGCTGVVIHKDLVIGENCMKARHVTIGRGNNVDTGANAVVCEPVSDNAVVAGVPAKILWI